MTIGIPRALGYHRYGVLWETFFQKLGIPCVVSEPTTSKHLTDGAKRTVDESCLPLKLYMGHVASLMGRCDHILVPRFRRLGRQEEFCVRFWGLYDTVQNTFPKAQLLSYQLLSDRLGHELTGFIRMGSVCGRGTLLSANAYATAVRRQYDTDQKHLIQSQKLLSTQGPKILLAAQSYVAHDPYLGGTVARLLREQGATPLFPDTWDQITCRNRSRELSSDLYWITSREILGAIQEARGQVDGIILLTAFPCGSDCLTNELILRRVRDLPVIQIILDDNDGLTGLQTRIESFLDMIAQRKQAQTV
ncbi:MAG: acyl-CoA dehydratase activase-related protein [Oscillospiraceae bacterium]|nr:acyl-CoA dehydratase activase-related protein [Oscillospiraceae bacterium]